MKAVVLTLALLFLTGGQAQHTLQQDDSQPQWGGVKDLAEMYMKTLKENGRYYVAQIETSDLAKGMKNLKFLDNFDALSAKITSLCEQLTPITSEFWESLENETAELTQEMNNDLKLVKEKAEPYLAYVRDKVKPLHEGVQAKLKLLKDKLGQLQNRTRTYVKTLEPFSDKVHKRLAARLQALREGGEGGDGMGLDKLRKEADQHLKAMWEKVKPMWDDLKTGMEPMWDSLQVVLFMFPHELTGQ